MCKVQLFKSLYIYIYDYFLICVWSLFPTDFLLAFSISFWGLGIEISQCDYLIFLFMLPIFGLHIWGYTKHTENDHIFLDDWLFYNHEIFLFLYSKVLKSTLSHISTPVSTCFWLVFTWQILFHPISFKCFYVLLSHENFACNIELGFCSTSSPTILICFVCFHLL